MKKGENPGVGTGMHLVLGRAEHEDLWKGGRTVVMQWRDGGGTNYKYTWGLELSGSIHGAGGVGGLLA